MCKAKKDFFKILFNFFFSYYSVIGPLADKLLAPMRVSLPLSLFRFLPPSHPATHPILQPLSFPLSNSPPPSSSTAAELPTFPGKTKMTYLKREEEEKKVNPSGQKDAIFNTPNC